MYRLARKMAIVFDQRLGAQRAVPQDGKGFAPSSIQTRRSSWGAYVTMYGLIQDLFPGNWIVKDPGVRIIAQRIENCDTKYNDR